MKDIYKLMFKTQHNNISNKRAQLRRLQLTGLLHTQSNCEVCVCSLGNKLRARCSAISRPTWPTNAA